MTPASFRKDLSLFDKELELVWSSKHSRWEIWHTDRKQIRYLVLFTEMGTLGTDILRRLWVCTPKKQGGAKRVNALMDDLAARDEAAKDRDLVSGIDAVTSSAYGTFKHRLGQRVFMPGFTMTDSRRVSA